MPTVGEGFPQRCQSGRVFSTGNNCGPSFAGLVWAAKACVRVALNAFLPSGSPALRRCDPGRRQTTREAGEADRGVEEGLILCGARR